MKRWIKKDKGNLTHIFPALLSVIIVALVAVIYTGWIADNDRKEAIDLIARKYILRMETTGYLSDEDEAELRTELSEEGLTGISLGDTTDSTVPYGSYITLYIRGNLTVKNYKVLQTFMLNRKSKEIPVVIQKTSTAKH